MRPSYMPSGDTYEEFGTDAVVHLNSRKDTSRKKEEEEEAPLAPMRKGTPSYLVTHQIPQAYRDARTYAMSGDITSAKEILAGADALLRDNIAGVTELAGYNGKNPAQQSLAKLALAAVGRSYLDEKIPLPADSGSGQGAEAVTLSELLNPNTLAAKSLTIRHGELDATLAAGKDFNSLAVGLANDPSDPYIASQANLYSGAVYQGTSQKRYKSGGIGALEAYQKEARARINELRQIRDYVKQYGGESEATDTVVQELKSKFVNNAALTNSIMDVVTAFSGGGGINQGNVAEVLETASKITEQFFQPAFTAGGAVVYDYTKMPARDVAVYTDLIRAVPGLLSSYSAGTGGSLSPEDTRGILTRFITPELRDKVQTAAVYGMFKAPTQKASNALMVDFLRTQFYNADSSYDFGYSKDDNVSKGLKVMDFCDTISAQFPTLIPPDPTSKEDPGVLTHPNNNGLRYTPNQAAVAGTFGAFSTSVKKLVATVAPSGLLSEAPDEWAVLEKISSSPNLLKQAVNTFHEELNQNPAFKASPFTATESEALFKALVNGTATAKGGNIDLQKIVNDASSTQANPEVVTQKLAEANNLVNVYKDPASGTVKEQEKMAEMVLPTVFHLSANSTGMPLGDGIGTKPLPTYVAQHRFAFANNLNKYVAPIREMEMLTTGLFKSVTDSLVFTPKAEGDTSPAVPKSWGELTEEEKKTFAETADKNLSINNVAYTKLTDRDPDKALRWGALVGGDEAIAAYVYEAVRQGNVNAVSDWLVTADRSMLLHSKPTSQAMRDDVFGSLSRAAHIDLSLIYNRLPNLRDPQKIAELQDAFLDALETIKTHEKGVSTSVYLQLGNKIQDDFGKGLEGVINEISLIDSKKAIKLIDALEYFNQGGALNPAVGNAARTRLRMQAAVHHLYGRLSDLTVEMDHKWRTSRHGGVWSGGRDAGSLVAMGVSPFFEGAAAPAGTSTFLQHLKQSTPTLTGLGLSGSGLAFSYLGTPGPSANASINQNSFIRSLGADIPDGIPGVTYPGDTSNWRAISSVTGSGLQYAGVGFAGARLFGGDARVQAIAAGAAGTLGMTIQACRHLLGYDDEDAAKDAYLTLMELLPEFSGADGSLPEGPFKARAQGLYDRLQGTLSVTNSYKDKAAAILNYMQELSVECDSFAPASSLLDYTASMCAGFTQGSQKHLELTDPSYILKTPLEGAFVSTTGTAANLDDAKGVAAKLDAAGTDAHQRVAADLVTAALKSNESVSSQLVSSKDPYLHTYLYSEGVSRIMAAPPGTFTTKAQAAALLSGLIAEYEEAKSTRKVNEANAKTAYRVQQNNEQKEKDRNFRITLQQLSAQNAAALEEQKQRNRIARDENNARLK